MDSRQPQKFEAAPVPSAKAAVPEPASVVTAPVAMRKRQRTVMNLPRSTSRLEMMIAQGPNMWWNFRKSRIWTMPKRNDHANIWFLKGTICNATVVSSYT